jgi:HAD superfamily hydrolase (TIGR01509 family)
VSLTFDLVIFDCDGVLIDSEVIACAVDARLLGEIGFQITAAQVAHRFAGIATRDMYAALEREMGRPLPEDYVSRKRALMREMCARELRAIPGVLELVRDLSKPVCVASSSRPTWLDYALKHVGLHAHFAPHIFSAELVEHGKPAPDLFLYAARQMGAWPSRSIVIEDSVPGVQAGKAAGMTVLGFCGAGHCGPDHAARLRKAGADQVFAEMGQVAAALAVAVGRDTPPTCPPA